MLAKKEIESCSFQTYFLKYHYHRNLELHFSLNWEEKQFKFNSQEKGDSGNLLCFSFLHIPANYSVILYTLSPVTNCEIKLIDVNKMSL